MIEKLKHWIKLLDLDGENTKCKVKDEMIEMLKHKED